MIRVQDFDVALPSANSPPGKFVNGQALTQLMMNLSAIEMLASRQQDIELAELHGLVQNLQDWISNVPPELALFDQNDYQRPHERWAVELHIYYFNSIILIYLLPGLHRQDPAFHSAAILASSCAVRLYEAMLYRDEINFLTPVHNWLTFVAAIPQLYPLAKSSTKTSGEETELIQSILLQLSTKHSGAKLCLCKLEDLQQNQAAKTSVVSNELGSNDIAAPLVNSSGSSLVNGAGALFPFPDNISPRMPELRSQLATPNQSDTDDNLQPPLSRDELVFDWADLNIDSFGFFGNSFAVDEIAPSYLSQRFNFSP
jgi:hypothetical protein